MLLFPNRKIIIILKVISIMFSLFICSFHLPLYKSMEIKVDSIGIHTALYSVCVMHRDNDISTEEIGTQKCSILGSSLHNANKC